MERVRPSMDSSAHLRNRLPDSSSEQDHNFSKSSLSHSPSADANIQTSGSWSSGPLARTSLENLRSYRYSGVDQSLLREYALKYYWDWAVELLPLWLAPNLVTLIGFLPIVAFVYILSFFDPGLQGLAPGWFYFGSACVIWFYSTMDNIDGKQARRTGTSSPLGELFDHGLDSLNCTLASLLHVSALGIGSTKMGAVAAILPCLPMYFSTWETFHTHTLFLGIVNGPTEGLVIVVVMLLMTAWYGTGVWASPIREFFPPFTHLIPFQASIRDLWAVTFGIASVALHLPFCVVHVRNVFAAKKRPFLPVLTEWLPISVFTGACIAWLGSPHSTILRENHLILFCGVLSLVFGRMTTKIILHHLTRQPFPMWTYMLFPLVLGAILVNRPLLGFEAVSPSFELWYLRIYGFYAAVIYFRWAFLVIDTLCSFLGIRCFTIPERIN